jgi:hypothetical protein
MQDQIKDLIAGLSELSTKLSAFGDVDEKLAAASAKLEATTKQHEAISPVPSHSLPTVLKFKTSSNSRFSAMTVIRLLSTLVLE